MNKYLRNILCVSFGATKVCFTKLFHFQSFSASIVSVISLRSEITLERGGYFRAGRFLKMRDGAKVRVRNGGSCQFGSRVSLGSGVMITCHERIEIGSGTQLSPNVMIFDHDHDFRVEGGLMALKYKTAPIVIGKNVWIGANTVVLRGTTIGDNTVIGAGSVIKGDYPSNSVIIQKRKTETLGG